MPARLSVAIAQAIAAEKGGECLSERYVNLRSKLVWRCDEGHVWTSSLLCVKNLGTWCPACGHASGAAKRSNDISVARRLAAEKGGVLISETYKNRGSHLVWQCTLGHRWNASYGHVSNGRWCPDCANISRREAQLVHTVEDAQAIASSRGGSCLSGEYSSYHKHLDWECSEGHRWSASFANVSTGTWCPHCNIYRTEDKIRDIFEELTGRAFHRVRPAWLRGLEVDGYCPEIAVAFEYQGEQHSRYVPFFHRNGPADLHRQQKRDQDTAERCGEHGVALIVVWHDTPAPEEYIRQELDLLGVLK